MGAEAAPHRRRRIRWPLSRTRLIELAVVVFGVMIALGLESLAEEIRLRGDARDLEAAFQDEIFYAVVYSWERQAAAPCLSQRLASLAERVGEGGEGRWEAAPDVRRVESGISFATPQVYRSPSRLWMTATFDRALGTEAFKRIPRDRADAYADVFAQIAERREVNGAEFFAGAGLAPLAHDQAAMNAETRADMLKQIALLDRYQAQALAAGDLMIETALGLPGDGVRSAVLANRSIFDGMAERMVKGNGSCVDLGATDRLFARAGRGA